MRTFSKIEMLMIKKMIQEFKLGAEYTMDGNPDTWKIAYYPLHEDGKTGEVYDEPRALIERPMMQGIKRIGTDFREVPLRYLTIKSI